MKFVQISALAACVAATPASAILIDNDLDPLTVGHWQVDARAGGQTRSGTLRADAAVSGEVTTDLIFDYFTYIQTGPGSAFQLSSVGEVMTGDDEVTSSGAFVGSEGNTIDYSVVSSIADGSSVFRNEFTFSASVGSLGTIRLFQYLDEDVLGAGNDVFFTRGSVAGDDLQLFTIDRTQLIGVSHGGGYSEATGLSNATFAGWAACDYNTQKGPLANGTQNVSLGGDICDALSPSSLSGVGPVYGPEDVVSVLAWDVTFNASTATIVTTLGGLPTIDDLPPITPSDVPAPGALGLIGLGLAGMAATRRRRR